MNKKKLNGLMAEYRAIPRTSDRDLKRVDLTNVGRATGPSKKPFYRRKAVWGAFAALVVVAIALPLSIVLFTKNGTEEIALTAEDAGPSKSKYDDYQEEFAPECDDIVPSGKNGKTTSDAVRAPGSNAAIVAEDVKYVRVDGNNEERTSADDAAEPNTIWYVRLKTTDKEIGAFTYGTSEDGTEKIWLWAFYGDSVYDERFVGLKTMTSERGPSYECREETTGDVRTTYAQYRDDATNYLYRFIAVTPTDKSFDEELSAMVEILSALS